MNTLCKIGITSKKRKRAFFRIRTLMAFFHSHLHQQYFKVQGEQTDFEFIGGHNDQSKEKTSNKLINKNIDIYDKKARFKLLLWTKRKYIQSKSDTSNVKKLLFSFDTFTFHRTRCKSWYKHSPRGMMVIWSRNFRSPRRP